MMKAILLVAAAAVISAPGAVTRGADAPAVPPLPGDDSLPPIAFMLDPKSPPPAGLRPPRLSSAPSPSLVLAATAAQTAIDACMANGIRIGVAVTDAEGNLRAALSADGAQVGRIYTAVRKDLAALAFGVPTSRLRSILASDPEALRRVTPGMAVFGGAVPLVRNSTLIGAIGASGGTTEQDEACAAAGAAKIEQAIESGK